MLKPKHSAFYQTCLALLLAHLGARTLVIGGHLSRALHAELAGAFHVSLAST